MSLLVALGAISSLIEPYEHIEMLCQGIEEIRSGDDVFWWCKRAMKNLHKDFTGYSFGVGENGNDAWSYNLMSKYKAPTALYECRSGRGRPEQTYDPPYSFENACIGTLEEMTDALPLTSWPSRTRGLKLDLGGKEWEILQKMRVREAKRFMMVDITFYVCRESPDVVEQTMKRILSTLNTFYVVGSSTSTLQSEIGGECDGSESFNVIHVSLVHKHGIGNSEFDPELGAGPEIWKPIDDLTRPDGDSIEKRCGGYIQEGKDRGGASYQWCKKALEMLPEKSFGHSFGILTWDPWSRILTNNFGIPMKLYDCYHTAESHPFEGESAQYNKPYERISTCVGGSNYQDEKGREFKRISDIIDFNEHKGPMRFVVKMDVEGSEWETLLTMTPAQHRKIMFMDLEIHWCLGKVKDGLQPKERAEEILRILGRMKDYYHVTSRAISKSYNWPLLSGHEYMTFDNPGCDLYQTYDMMSVSYVNKMILKETPYQVVDDPHLYAPIENLTRPQPIAEELCGGYQYSGSGGAGYAWCKKAIDIFPKDIVGHSFGIFTWDRWSKVLSNTFGITTHLYDCYTTTPFQGSNAVYKTPYHRYDVCVGAKSEVKFGGKVFKTVHEVVKFEEHRPLSLILKFDVEGSEWETLRTMTADDHEKIIFMDLEIHWCIGTPEAGMGIQERAREIFKILMNLRKYYYVTGREMSRSRNWPLYEPLLSGHKLQWSEIGCDIYNQYDMMSISYVNKKVVM
eukprot:m.340857 g.340857  ORF g.340857 m.340857 type:complete len:738 (+) comp19604_c0_seq1:189-2402(+)